MAGRPHAVAGRPHAMTYRSRAMAGLVPASTHAFVAVVTQKAGMAGTRPATPCARVDMARARSDMMWARWAMAVGRSA